MYGIILLQKGDDDMYNNAQEILQDVRNLQEYEFINKNEHLKK